MTSKHLLRNGVLAILLVLGLQVSGWGGPPVETLFPPSTRGFLAIHNVQELRDRFSQTQIGQLVQDPALQPFVEDLRHQIQDRLAGTQEQLGITLEDVAAVATGEVGVGVIFPEKAEQTGLVAVMTIERQRNKAEELFKRIRGEAEKRQGKVEDITLQKVTVQRISFPSKADGTPGRELFYYLSDQYLIASNDRSTMEAVLKLLMEKGESLASVVAFKQIMDRCARDLPEGEPPQIRWFIEPFEYAQAMRTVAPADRRRRSRQLIERLKAAGFSAFQGVGGVISFASEDFELVHRTFVYAPPPREKSAKMIDLPNGEAFKLPTFIPRDLATVGMGYCNILTGFDNIGPLFNQTVGEGEEGVWEDVLLSLKEDESGPRIDLRNEFFVHFGEKVTLFTAYRLPITTTSERVLIAIEVKDEKGATAGLAKLLRSEPRFRKREYKGKVIWEGVPEEKKDVPRIELGGIPGVGDSSRQEEAKSEPVFPNASLTIHEGFLLIASHYDYLTEILDLESEKDSIARNPDFLEVMETIEKIGGREACWRAFSLTDEEYRPTYELIRQGKMPESETMLGRILNTVLTPPEKGVARQQRIDGSKLPDYELIRRHLGPAGVFAVTEPDGWFIKGFTLPKK